MRVLRASVRVDEPWVQYNSATVGASYRRYLHADHQGSIIAQSSNTGGVIFRNAYDPYGIPREGNTGRFGYTGQAWLPELGLYHYKARMYHPKLGRFLQTDPIGYGDDMNMYAYVRNDPFNSRDPDGLKCVGAGDESKCTIDYIDIGTKKKSNWVSRAEGIKSGVVTEKQVSRLEGNLTKGYRAAQELGENKITVKGDQKLGIKTTEVTGNRMAMVMQDQALRISNRYATNSKSGAEEKNWHATAVVGGNAAGITYWKPGLTASGYHQQHSMLHESLHFVPRLYPWEKYPVEHQAPFRAAIEEIMGAIRTQWTPSEFLAESPK